MAKITDATSVKELDEMLHKAVSDYNTTMHHSKGRLKNLNTATVCGCVELEGGGKAQVQLHIISDEKKFLAE